VLLSADRSAVCTIGDAKCGEFLVETWTKRGRSRSSGERLVSLVAEAFLAARVGVRQLVSSPRRLLSHSSIPVGSYASLPFVLAPWPSFSSAPRVHHPHPSPGPHRRDLVAVHRSVENESTSCREPSWRDSHLRALPRDRYFLRILYATFFAAAARISSARRRASREAQSAGPSRGIAPPPA